jgi:hypothetical protein
MTIAGFIFGIWYHLHSTAEVSGLMVLALSEVFLLFLAGVLAFYSTEY